ncbi:hypothetical protein AERO9A_370268 [Aeromonas salmonicida]|nr:hypothetical protein AERO9A_370268 [Aeromonas salmonicida]
MNRPSRYCGPNKAPPGKTDQNGPREEARLAAIRDPNQGYSLTVAELWLSDRQSAARISRPIALGGLPIASSE